MIDHTGVKVPTSKFEKTKAFYITALAPLGYKLQFEFGPTVIGLGPDKSSADFWIGGVEEVDRPGIHIAFRAKDKEAVDAFHAAAVKSGGTCNGPPGPRPHYAPGYYAAFVLDPAGNNIEVIIRNYEAA